MPPRPTGAPFALSLRRAILRRRRAAASLLAMVAVVAAVQLVAPPDPATERVWVAARDLPAGTTLGPADVREVGVAPSAVPEHATTSSQSLVGRLLAGPMRTGEPFTDRRLVGPALLAGYAEGLVATPVTLPGRAAVSLLAVGDHIDAYAALGDGGQAAELVAADAVVLALPEQAEGSRDTATVVLAVTPEQTARLAQAAATSVLTLSIRR